MHAVHHTAIVTTDVELSVRFWRDGIGLIEMLDYTFTGDWPTLLGADTDVLRSVFLGDPESPDSGIVELVFFEGVSRMARDDDAGPRPGMFLLSLERDVEATLGRLAELGFTDGVRRITMPAPRGKTVAMAVVIAPDGVRVGTDRGADVSAVVVGGASGIGSAVVSRLRAAGHSVMVWDLAGGDITCDISEPDSVAAAMDHTVRTAGTPDRFITCAGVGASGLLLEAEPHRLAARPGRPI